MTWRLVVPRQLYQWFENDLLEPAHSFHVQAPEFFCDVCGARIESKGGLSIFVLGTELIDLTGGKCAVSPRLTELHPLTKCFEAAFATMRGPCKCMFARCKIGKSVQRKQHAQFNRRTYR